MPRVRPLAALCFCLSLFAAACGSDEGSDVVVPAGCSDGDVVVGSVGEDSIFPQVIASDLSTEEGLWFPFSIQEGPEVGSLLLGDEGSVRVDFYGPDSDCAAPDFSVDGEFVWITEPRFGFWAADVSFDRPGVWGALFVVERSGETEEAEFVFSVQPEPRSLAVGESMPPIDTLSLNDVNDGDLRTITTDSVPAERLYEMSVAEALAAEVPFLLVVATPKYCTSAVCAPTLDLVKGMLDDLDEDFTVIHAEVYDDLTMEVLTEDAELAPIMDALNLPTEPWTYLVDANGIVADRWEGSISPRHVEAAIAAL